MFTSADLEGLAEPVRRHLARAIAPGTPLTRCARPTMRGSIKIGRWLPFRARQILSPHEGFVWAARVAGVIAGSDHYLDGSGKMDWKLAGSVTVAHADGADHVIGVRQVGDGDVAVASSVRLGSVRVLVPGGGRSE